MLIGIALVAANGVIGDGEDQPLKFSEDFARFKQVTMGHPMIMGRKTFQALGSRLLPGRTTIVVSSTPDKVVLPKPSDENTFGIVAGSLTEAVTVACRLDKKVFVCGGGQIYAQLFDQLAELDLTIAHEAAEGTVKFPEIDPNVWVEVSRQPREKFDFVTFTRRPVPETESAI